MTPRGPNLMKICLLIFLIASCPLFGLDSRISDSKTKRYDPGHDARAVFASARAMAVRADRHLMVVFGADWCPDCRKLHDNLMSDEVTSYMRDHMDFLTVDVGRKDLNIDFAKELGVTVSNGIPVAVFFDSNGDLIGTTNRGELEPSRYFTSTQILAFVKKIVEQQSVSQPVVNKRLMRSSAAN